MAQFKNSQSGFTLIELLVVIAIIGLLASIVLTSVNAARASARDSRRKADIRQVDTAIQEYIIDQGHAPYLGAMNCSASGPDCGIIYDNSAGWDILKTELSPYMNTLPKDPCGVRCNGGANLQFAYFYRPPSNMAQSCNNLGCGLGTSALNEMYILGGTNLETANGKWGNNHGFANSF